LENKIIARLQGGQAVIGEFVNPIKVDIHQFYGIEINDFAVSVATTALWIAELQMLRETRKVAHFSDTPLPLKTYHNIHEGNALRVDWAEIIAPERLNYIMGNPPFVGYALQNKTQKEDLALSMSDIGKNIDYVAGWYYKAAQMMTQNKTIRAAFVSTNSITQGEQVAAIWKPLFERYGIHFDFAYPTFRWDSESNLKAHVHCVIIGFSCSEELNSLWQRVAAANSPAPLAGRGQGAGKMATQVSPAPASTIASVSSASTIAPPPNPLPASEAGELLCGTTLNGAGELQSEPTDDAKNSDSEGKIHWGENTNPIPKTMNVSYLREQRRDLRTNGTSAEGALWNILKAKQINGLQFRRQFSVENDILDFYCPKLRLAIELDGDYHFHGWQRDLDRQRDENLWLKHGIYVLRFENKIVFENPRVIVQSIMKYHEDCTNPQLVGATNSPMQGGIAMNSPAPLAGRGQGAGKMATQVSPAPASRIASVSSASTIAPPPNPLPASGAGELQCGTTLSGEGELRSVPKRRLYNADGTYKLCHNINGYLLDAPSIFVENRKHPLCNVPEMTKGSSPVDGGHLIIEADEYDDFIAKDPCSVKYIRRMVGSEDFINNKIRYCLWLVDASPAELRQCPEVMKRIAQVREMRLASTKEATRKYADFPTRLMEIRQPNSNYLLIPRVSSERRRYVPIGFVDKDIICNDGAILLPNITLYHFGVLTSNVHMAWMRAVCGRLKSDYRYSNTIVYNNFPWAITPPPNLDVHWTSLHPASGAGELHCGTTLNAKDSAAVAKIMQTAQGILDARALYPDCSLADLYDEVTRPIALRRAHQANDRAVMEAYGFSTKMTESECVARLLEMYQALI
ncbi:MAG: endonuclease domain-containing protein, partial [Paludibacteraceae bacterium]|nr:endonuclease domain-containing protein [Paludibacteraceae bacterium]